MLKVVHGKDRSGFHGTTIQPAFRKPSEKNEPSELIGDEISLPPTKVGEKIEYMIGVASLNLIIERTSTKCMQQLSSKT